MWLKKLVRKASDVKIDQIVFQFFFVRDYVQICQEAKNSQTLKLENFRMQKLMFHNLILGFIEERYLFNIGFNLGERFPVVDSEFLSLRLVCRAG